MSCIEKYGHKKVVILDKMKSKTKLKSVRRYDTVPIAIGIKSNAIALVENGRSIKSVCESLGLNRSVLYYWIRQKKAKNVPLQESLATTNEMNEKKKIAKLEQELVQVKQERDILKVSR